MKKAKNLDPNGQEVSWFDDEGIQHRVTVEPDHELPDKLDDGTNVPARVRDDLLGRDNWAEVNRAAGDKAKGE